MTKFDDLNFFPDSNLIEHPWDLTIYGCHPGLLLPWGDLLCLKQCLSGFQGSKNIQMNGGTKGFPLKTWHCRNVINALHVEAHWSVLVAAQRQITTIHYFKISAACLWYLYASRCTSTYITKQAQSSTGSESDPMAPPKCEPGAALPSPAATMPSTTLVIKPKNLSVPSVSCYAPRTLKTIKVPFF